MYLFLYPIKTRYRVNSYKVDCPEQKQHANDLRKRVRNRNKILIIKTTKSGTLILYITANKIIIKKITIKHNKTQHFLQ